MIFLRKKEAVVVAPKEELTTIGSIAAERINKLAKENGISVDNAAEEIGRNCFVCYKAIDAVMHGSYSYFLPSGHVVEIIPETVILIFCKAAEYFNTSLDYILGLTDRMY